MENKKKRKMGIFFFAFVRVFKKSVEHESDDNIKCS